MILNPYSFGVDPALLYSYSNLDGSGDRTGLVIVGGTLTQVAGAGAKTNLINNNFSNNSTGSFRCTGSQSNKTLSFQFFDALGASYNVQIDQFKLFTSDGTDQGTLKWQAFGGVDVTSNFSIAGATTTVDAIATPVANTFTLLIGGPTVNTPWWQEVQFRIRTGIP